jgi:hypothetical protein
MRRVPSSMTNSVSGLRKTADFPSNDGGWNEYLAAMSDSVSIVSAPAAAAMNASNNISAGILRIRGLVPQKGGGINS